MTNEIQTSMNSEARVERQGSRSLWRKPINDLRIAEDELESASLCLEGTFYGAVPPQRAGIRLRSIEVIRGWGAPAPRIIGLGGTWVWSSPPQSWLREQAARYAGRAAAARKRAARSHRTLRRRRDW